jgi:hypothetical protein
MNIENIEEVEKIFKELNVSIFRTEKRGGHVSYFGTGGFSEEELRIKFNKVQIEYKKGFFPHVIFKF